MVVSQEGQKVAAFDVQASLEEWREMPVAKRPLPKGSVVGPDDFMMARMNMNALPRDVAKNESGVVGLKLSQEIAPGEVFRRQHLMIPPLVEAGQRVSLMYRSKLLEASAVGIALQQGAQGDVITVKNENSKKVVSGVVTEAGVVEVRP
jgi:flagella basal body P-ring formation protein FlgA